MTIVPVGKLILQELQGHEDAYVQELCAALQGHIQEIIGRSLDGVLKAEVDKWLGRDPYTRRRRSKRQKVKERCSRCLSHQRQNFRRNGCYRRDLNTCWGKIELNVPQVKCACGGNVRLKHRAFRPGQRMWDDFAVEVRLDYGHGLSYRQIKAEWDKRLGGSVGLRTLNRRVLEAVPVGVAARPLKQDEVPPVVRVDAIWITVMFPTGETKQDRMGRMRPVKQAKKVAILAAQGVWPDTGRSVLLAWMLAEGEDHNSWQIFWSGCMR